MWKAQIILFSSVGHGCFPSVDTFGEKMEKFGFILFQFQECPQSTYTCALFPTRTTKVFWKYLIAFDMKVDHL